MRVPAPVTNEVVTDSKELGYLQTPPGVGAGLNALGQSLSQLGEVFAQRQEKTNRFNAMVNFSQFQTDAANTQTELKRNASPDGKDFAKQAGQIYDKNAATFIANNIPKDLQDEYRARLAQEKQSIMGDAYKFQYEAGDAWFKENVSKEYNKSLETVSKTPDRLDGETKRISEIIDATDLPEVEKHQLKENMHVGLLGAQYYQKVKTAHEDALATQSVSITEGNQGAKTLLHGYEGFSPTPYWDSNAYRIGFGSDTYQENGRTHVVTKDTPPITRAQAEADLDYRLSQREGAEVRRQLGETWGQLSPQTQAALLSVGYNYGSLPGSVVSAAKSGDMGKLADTVAGLDANPGRRHKEAAIIRGQTDIKSDPRYDDIPYDDRVKIENQAEAAAQKEYTEQQTTQKLQNRQKINDLFVSLYDGNAGPVDIQKARDEGWLSTFKDIARANQIYAKSHAESDLALSATQKLDRGEPWDFKDTTTQKQANALMAQNQGIQKLGQKDEGFFSNTVLPFISQTGMVAPNVRGTLIGMYSTARDGMDAWAIDAISRIKATNPEAYLHGFPGEIRKQVDAWDQLKGTFKDSREALGWIKGGADPNQRRAQLDLIKEGKDYLSQSKDHVTNLQTKVSTLVKGFDQSYFGANPAPLNAVVEQSLTNEYNDEFVKAYSIYGNPEQADVAATKAIHENWGVSPSDNTIMKYPPQNMGYSPTLDGSYDWIPNSIRDELKLPANTQIHFMSDEQTKQDYEKWVSDPDHNSPPAYHVYVTDENGVTKALLDKDGVPLPPMWFKKPEAVTERDKALFDWKDAKQKMQDRLDEIIKMKMNLSTLNRFSGQPQRELPPELEDEQKQLEKNIKKLDTQNPANANDTFEMPSTDVMGNPY